MDFGNGIILNLVPLWTWSLLFMRCLGMIEIIPALGTSQIPATFRLLFVFCLSLFITLSGVQVELPLNLAQALILLILEFLLGVALGLIPAIIINGVGVAGQVISGAIGLGQANMMDHSLGEQTAVLSKLQVMLATVIFLLLNGHHIVIQACAGMLGNLEIGTFVPNYQTLSLLLYNLKESFEFAVILAAPLLVTALITNFVLGLITKFVPQMNIFIISLPLGILVGLYILAFSTSNFKILLANIFNAMNYSILRLFMT
ncbi:MAG: flagellar biosynthetic protein FliR [Deltaproteobacteria bacterium]|jgi:flagellar biosynthetic protein FliR|nr:flagellar biosynthetic protein FliR [Deltaproteobacteria bacterium]